MQGLKYSDIDKKQNVIHVQSTLKYIEGQGYIEDTPKTRTSTRDIPLTAAVAEHIEAKTPVNTRGCTNLVLIFNSLKKGKIRQRCHSRI